LTFAFVGLKKGPLPNKHQCRFVSNLSLLLWYKIKKQ